MLLFCFLVFFYFRKKQTSCPKHIDFPIFWYFTWRKKKKIRAKWIHREYSLLYYHSWFTSKPLIHNSVLTIKTFLFLIIVLLISSSCSYSVHRLLNIKFPILFSTNNYHNPWKLSFFMFDITVFNELIIFIYN